MTFYLAHSQLDKIRVKTLGWIFRRWSIALMIGRKDR